MTQSDGEISAPSVISATLSGVRLPMDGPLRRKMPRAPHRRSPEYIENFDAHTVVYDCFYDPLDRVVTLVCPRLLNLWPTLRNGFTLDGTPTRPRRQTRIRTDYLRFRVLQKPQTLRLSIGDWHAEIPINDSLSTNFTDLNCITAVSKDNDPAWIADWARYHVSAHGTEAVMIFDNASKTHTTPAVLSALKNVQGLKVVAVIAADFPFGPTSPGGWKWEISSMFFQTAMLNIARLRFFASARAVLSVDIDELVASKNGESVFDAAVRSRLGLTSFWGKWAYVEGATTPQPQKRHVWTTDGVPKANTKWCVAPCGRLGAASWQVHRLAEAVFRFTANSNFHFWHCRQTTTNWKVNRMGQPKRLKRDSSLEQLFSRHLPEIK